MPDVGGRLGQFALRLWTPILADGRGAGDPMTAPLARRPSPSPTRCRPAPCCSGERRHREDLDDCGPGDPLGGRGLVTLPEMLIVTFGRAASQSSGPACASGSPRWSTTWASHRRCTKRDRAGRPPSRHDRPRDRGATAAHSHRIDPIRRGHHRHDAPVLPAGAPQQGVAGTTDASAVLVEDLDDVLVDVVDDLYLGPSVRHRTPRSSGRSEALTIARTAVDDIHAQLRPSGADPTGDVGRRVRFAQAVRDEVDVRKRRLQVMHYKRPAHPTRGSPRSAGFACTTAHAGSLASGARRRVPGHRPDSVAGARPGLHRPCPGHGPHRRPQAGHLCLPGGDVVTYLRAAATAGTAQTLATNHRSDEPVVRALGAFLGGGRTRRPSDRCPSRRRSPSRLTVGRYAVRRPGSPAPGPARGPPG